MYMKFSMKSKCRHLLSIMLILMALCISCEDDQSKTETPSQAYDPSKPLIVSDFLPKEGGAYQKMVIYGENFGNDSSLVDVTIGGKKAVIINVQSNNMYVFVPSGAFSGEVSVTVGSDDKAKTATADAIFNYQKKMVVGTLVGYRNEYDNQGWKDGPFETAAGFRNDGEMRFDPLNPVYL